MKKLIAKLDIPYVFIFLVVLLSRLPFINAGLGTDRDAWRVACAARYIANTGEYVASRLPGYPIPEFIYSLMWGFDFRWWNLITSALSGVSAVVLAHIGKKYVTKDEYILLSLVFAFTSIIFVNSTTAMDYIWALTFILIAWYALISSKILLAGFFLGIASGCRFTSLLMLFPMLTAIVFDQTRNKKITRSIILVLMTIATTALAYLPVFNRYGFNFLKFHFSAERLLTAVFRAIFFEVWGIIGSVSLIAGWMFFLVRYRQRINTLLNFKLANGIWLLIIVMYFVLYLCFPFESAYLIPIVPFLYLFISRVFPKWLFNTVSICIIVSAFLIGIDSADRPWSAKGSYFSSIVNVGDRRLLVDWLQGPVLIEQNRRIQHRKYVDHIIAIGDTMSNRSVFITGVWMPYFILATENALPDNSGEYVLTRGNVDYVDLLSKEKLEAYMRRGMEIFYLTGVDEYLYNEKGFNICDYGARELFVE